MQNNIERIEQFKTKLEKIFVNEISIKKNTMEQIKIIKENMLNVLSTTHEIASLANKEKIYDTSMNIKNIEVEMERIKKDILSIAVFGQMGTGKSSFLNSLVGENLLTVSQSRATTTLSVVRHIDNFEGYEKDEIEIFYKSEIEILGNIIEAIEEWNEYFETDKSFTIPDTLEDILSQKEKIKETLETSGLYKDVSKDYRPNAQSLGKLISYVINGLDSQKENLGKVRKTKTLQNNELTSVEMSVFLEKIVFYKDIPLLKGLEFVDTPGFGSNSQLDTRKSEKFIEKADIVIVLTDAREPLQKDSEQKIFHILEDIQKYNQDFFQKVFVVINKVDECDFSRNEILEKLNEELENLYIEIPEQNKLFISAYYEIQKKSNKNGLESLQIRNLNNIGENDFEILEQTIYSFSKKEATSKFINENIEQIDSIFKNSEDNFKNSLQKIDSKLEDIEKNISKYEKQKSEIEKELEEEFEIMNKSVSINYSGNMTKKSTEIKIEKIEKGEKYFTKRIKNNPTKYSNWKKSKNDATYSSCYKSLAKNEINEIKKEINVELEEEHNRNIKINSEELTNSINEKIEKMVKKYNENFGVSISIPETTSTNFTKLYTSEVNNEDLEITWLKAIKQFINILIYGTTDKRIEISAEAYEKHMKDVFVPNLKKDIKQSTDEYHQVLETTTNNIVQNILSGIQTQLEQQRNEQSLTGNEKEKILKEKEYVKQAFEDIKRDYISAIKNQNTQIFK